LMSLFAIATFACTYTKKLRAYLVAIAYALFYGAIVWFIWLLYKNNYNINYFLGFILVIYVSMLGFKRPLHLICYILTVIAAYTITIVALKGNTEANLYIITILMLSMFMVSYFTLHAKWQYEETINNQNAELVL